MLVGVFGVKAIVPLLTVNGRNVSQCRGVSRTMSHIIMLMKITPSTIRVFGNHTPPNGSFFFGGTFSGSFLPLESTSESNLTGSRKFC